MNNNFLRSTFLIALFLAIIPFSFTQNYQISFTGSGQSNTIETIEVKNIDQGTSIMLAGNDVLQLDGVLGLNTINTKFNEMLVYPNPTNESSRIEFYSNSGTVNIELFDFSGKKLAGKTETLQDGMHIFSVNGLGSGVHLIKIKTPEATFAQRIISTSDAAKAISIEKEGSSTATPKNSQLKSTSDHVLMQYNDGERLLFKGISGNYTHILTMVPTQSQIVDFNFVECTDADGNHYSVVAIGDQLWMAENLKTSTYTSGGAIPGPFSGAAWVTNSTNAKLPAHTIYDHNHSSAEGLESPEEVVAAYGKMYNWYAIEAGNICPAGWQVPDTTQWNVLISYIIDAENIFDETNIAVAVKSCRQINSPLGGDCATNDHPRWRENSQHYGTDNYGFGLIAAGYILSSSGNSSWMGSRGYWWTSSAHSTNPDLALFRRFNFDDSVLTKGSFNKGVGQPVRCIKIQE